MANHGARVIATDETDGWDTGGWGDIQWGGSASTPVEAWPVCHLPGDKMGEPLAEEANDVVHQRGNRIVAVYTRENESSRDLELVMKRLTATQVEDLRTWYRRRRFDYYPDVDVDESIRVFWVGAFRPEIARGRGGRIYTVTATLREMS